MTSSTGELFKPVATTATAYVLLLALGYGIQFFSTYWGTWFSIILILWQVSYLLKISEGTKRFTRHEFLPALTTWGMATL
jgi:TM2 domain-containing membrane protein YozV